MPACPRRRSRLGVPDATGGQAYQTPQGAGRALEGISLDVDTGEFACVVRSSESGKTILCITHDVEGAVELADRSIVMR